MAVSAMTTGPDEGRSITWYEDTSNAFRVLAMASASRCVLKYPPNEVPSSVRDAAQEVHRILSQRPDADVRHYVTHEHGPDGALVPKRRPSNGEGV